VHSGVVQRRRDSSEGAEAGTRAIGKPAVTAAPDEDQRRDMGPDRCRGVVA